MAKQKQYKRYTRSRVGNVFYFSFLTLAGLFSIVPLIYTVCTAFKPLEELLIFPPRFFVSRPTLENFKVLPSLLSNLRVPLSRYIFNSIFISIATTFLQIIVSAMAAFKLSKDRTKSSAVIFLIVQFSLLYNGTTLGVPQYLIISNLHVIDTYMAYILPALASSMGVFLIKQYMDGSIPDALLEAAKIDGASILQIFWRIVMPLSKPAWMTMVLFSFQAMWATSPSSGTIFREELKTLPYVMSTIGAGGIARAGSAMAISVIMILPPILVYFISQSNIMETMSQAGMKG